MSLLLAISLLSMGTVPAAAQEYAWFEEPDPPGTSIGLTTEDLTAVETYAPDQPIIGTYLFYWYDVYAGEHLLDPDGSDACTTHPVSWEDYSYHSTRWWRQELTDIAAAGIDFAAAIYWGHPDNHGEQPFVGLTHLVRACDYMKRQGEACPRVALSYDTSTLQFSHDRGRIDLATPDGKAWFYCSIRDFFSYLPPRHWAAIGGRPIVILYWPGFAARQDPELFPYVRRRFQRDFHVDPYIIKQESWQGEADNTCEWGGALGLKLAGCAALGPGYDHSAVPGRTPLVRDREDGAFYSRSWEKLLKLDPRRRPSLAMVETWNEFHEGTDVAHSAEFGRQYIELTRKYADLFHARECLRPPDGPYSSARELTAAFDGTRESGGIAVGNSGDGLTELAEVAGRGCVQSAPNGTAGRFIYFGLDDSFAFDIDPRPVTIRIEYYDGGCDAFMLEYDSLDASGSGFAGAFKPDRIIDVAGTGEWRTVTFDLSDARLANRTNGHDFRIAVYGDGELSIASVKVVLGD